MRPSLAPHRAHYHLESRSRSRTCRRIISEVEKVGPSEMAQLVQLNTLLETKYGALIDADDVGEAARIQTEIDELEERAAQMIANKARRSIEPVSRRLDAAVAMAEQLLADEIAP